MNSIVEYMYRDAGNNKQWEEIVVSGGLCLGDLQPYLVDGLWFVPEEVGLMPLQPQFTDYPNRDDHPWHELVDVRPTEKEPGWIEAEALIQKFRDADQRRHRRSA
jgi:hypothetical protein